ncbi:TEL2, telomere maintenance protein 2, partial [Dinochytrium kinnereticum]
MEAQAFLLRNQLVISELMDAESGRLSLTDDVEALKGSVHFFGFVWSDLTTLRATFNSQHLARLQTILLKVISSKWLPLFSNKERALLFDEFFVGKDVNPIISLDSLSSFLPYASHAFQIERVEKILQTLFDRFPVAEILESLACGSTAKNFRNWDKYISLVSTLPSRMSNATKGSPKRFFQSENFVRMLVGQVGKLQSSTHDHGKNIAMLLSRLIRNGYGAFVSEEMAESFLADSEVLNAKPPSWKSVWENLSTSDAESVLYPNLCGYRFKNYRMDVIRDNSAVHHVLSVVFLLKRNLPMWSLKSLIAIYFNFQDPHPLSPLSITRRLLSVWASPYFASNSDEPRFKYIHFAIMLCISRLDDSGVSKLQSDTMQGVQHYLELTVPMRRNYGLVITETIFNRCTPSEPLSFELVEDEELLVLRRLGSQEKAEDILVPLTPKLHLKDETNEKDQGQDNYFENFDDEEDPDMPAVRPVGDSDDDESDDEELQPLQPPGFDDRPNVKKPVYIGECIDLLKEDNPDSTELVLQTLPSILAVSEPRDIAENSTEIFRRIFQVTESSHITNFETLRHSSLLAICSTCPSLVSSYILQEVPSTSYNISQRVELLNLIALVSVKLGVDVKDGRPPESKWSVVTMDHVGMERRKAHFGTWRAGIFYGILKMSVDA